MAVSCQSVPPLRSGYKLYWSRQVQFSDGFFFAQFTSTTAFPSRVSFTPVFKVVHSIVEHPHQEWDTGCCATTTELMAETVYSGDIQPIDTDH